MLLRKGWLNEFELGKQFISKLCLEEDPSNEGLLLKKKKTKNQEQ